MKSRALLFFLLAAAPLFACSDHIYRLALNQRSTYNPAALCPYCGGSSFASGGINSGPAGTGYFFSAGNDGDNLVHGPWDISYTHVKSPMYKSNTLALRYAYQFDIGSWHAAAGVRASRLFVQQQVVEGATTNTYKTGCYDFDLGFMVTNLRGFYAGVSVLHLLNPVKNLTTESGLNYRIEADRSYVLVAGTAQDIGGPFDIMPDIALVYGNNETTMQPGLMLRVNRKFGAGAGVIVGEGRQPLWELRAGYTSSVFKWICSFSPSPQGWTSETGVVVRFGQVECTGGGGPPKTKKEKYRHDDDFKMHR